jgi:UDP-glucose 4-epimerase
MRVLITGGCGFIGSHLIEYHLGKGDEVHTVDNLSTGTLHNIEPFRNNAAFRFDHADLLTWPDLDSAVKSVDRIYHFAAVVGIFKVISDPVNVITSNIIACRRLLQAIADNHSSPTVILASSSSAYGDSPKNPLNENDNLIVKPPTHPLATYAISKIADEAIGLAYYRTAKIPVIMPRLFNTIGPRQTGRYGMVVPRFVQQALNNEPFTIFGDGTQTRSFCDVRDVVSALDKLADKPEAIGEIINVGNNHEISINDLAKLVCKCLGKQNQSQYIPYKEAYGMEFTDITQRRPDLSKLNNLIKFKHEWTLEQTINCLILNYRNITV